MLDKFHRAFAMLARSPSVGHARPDLTKKPVLFWPVGTYLVIYQRDLRPLEVVAVLHGRRDVKKALGERSGGPARH
jgi:antitoxin ParD1/3/4